MQRWAVPKENELPVRIETQTLDLQTELNLENEIEAPPPPQPDPIEPNVFFIKSEEIPDSEEIEEIDILDAQLEIENFYLGEPETETEVGTKNKRKIKAENGIESLQISQGNS